MTMVRWCIGLAALLLAAGGCALTSKSEPLAPRYYQPDLSSLPARPAAEAEKSLADAPALRLGRVSAAAHLRERLVFRLPNRELGFYEDRRWTETPDSYLHRALAEVLFEREGLRRSVGGAGLTLDVELLDFEEVKSAHPVAHVRATLLLHDGRSVMRERTVDVQRPIAAAGAPPGDEPDAAVQAMSEALAELVNRIATTVVEVAKKPSP